LTLILRKQFDFIKYKTYIAIKEETKENKEINDDKKI